MKCLPVIEHTSIILKEFDVIYYFLTVFFTEDTFISVYKVSEHNKNQFLLFMQYPAHLWNHEYHQTVK